MNRIPPAANVRVARRTPLFFASRYSDRRVATGFGFSFFGFFVSFR
jgi:hypothetical protein